jgi:hypothetical protein
VGRSKSVRKNHKEDYVIDNNSDDEQLSREDSQSSAANRKLQLSTIVNPVNENSKVNS